MRLLVFSGLSDTKLISKLEPIVSLEKVEKVYLIRNSPLQHPKIKSYGLPVCLNILFLREFIKLIHGLKISLTKKIDYIIGIYLRPHGLFAYVIGKVVKKPVIQLFVGNDVDLIEKYKKSLKNLLKTAKFIGVRGSRSKKRLNSIVHQEEKFFILDNVFIPPEISQSSVKTPKKNDIICVGDFTKAKRIDVFLKVIARIKRRNPDIRAVMVGGDGKRSRFEKMKSRMNLDPNVFFKGRVNNIYSYLADSKVFLLTSEAEGLPMSLIEAMSMGLPSVVPNIGDIPDLARNGDNAFLINSLDEKDFTSRVIQLLEDEKMYDDMSRNAYETIQRKKRDYSSEYIQSIWDKILD